MRYYFKKKVKGNFSIGSRSWLCIEPQTLEKPDPTVEEDRIRIFSCGVDWDPDKQPYLAGLFYYTVLSSVANPDYTVCILQTNQQIDLLVKERQYFWLNILNILYVIISFIRFIYVFFSVANQVCNSVCTIFRPTNWLSIERNVVLLIHT